MTLTSIIILILSVSVIVVILVVLWRTLKELNNIRTRFAPAISLQKEVDLLEGTKKEVLADIQKLKEDYKVGRKTFERLNEQITSYNEELAFREMGVYEPIFDFTDSEEYKMEIKKVRERQKARIKAKTAVIVKTEWTVGGSKAKGRTMVNRAVRLTLRAFNNECDVAIAKARWNNVHAMENRIKRAAKQINALNASNDLEIHDEYLKLKMDELHLTHEYKERLQEEKELRKEQARLEREERRLQSEAKAAAKEEAKYARMLEKAKKEAGGEISAELQARIDELEKSLRESQEKKERAQSMAEQTKAGHVYVISNIGSFGKYIVKIGMTRRLNPDDRVKELGDASVPFIFDTHAMVYSKNAPELEKTLHKRFNDHRVNAVNMRKEFFQVPLEDVASAVREFDSDARFVMDREAREYMETLALREQMDAAQEEFEELEEQFPLTI